MMYDGRANQTDDLYFFLICLRDNEAGFIISADNKSIPNMHTFW